MNKLLLLTSFLFLASCNEQEYCSLPKKNFQEYSDLSCWTNSQGKFFAFVIISPQKNGAIPTYISSKCVLRVQDRDELTSNASSLPAVFVDEFTYKPDKIILSNSTVFSPVFSLNDNVYSLKSDFKITENHTRIMVLTKIDYFKNLKKNVSQFFEDRSKSKC